MSSFGVATTVDLDLVVGAVVGVVTATFLILVGIILGATVLGVFAFTIVCVFLAPGVKLST